LQGAADGHRHGSARRAFGIIADGKQDVQVKLFTQGADDRPDKQRREKPLRHRAQGVNAVAFHRKLNRSVLKLQFQNSFRLKTRFHKALA
jgi:hypothetical protein